MIDNVTFKSERQQNIYLIYKYLKQQCLKTGVTVKQAEQETQSLILKYKDNLFGRNGLAVMLGAQSIEFFCLYFLQDTFLPKPDNTARILAPVHYKIWQELENMFLNDLYDKMELIMPRGCAKTTVCDYALSVWLHCYKKSVYTLIAGKTEQDATEFIAQVRQTFEENPYIIKAFGKLIDTKHFIVNKLELELSNYTKIQAISSTSSMRGKKYAGDRPSCIIADDYQGQADCITDDARDKKYKTWVEDSTYAGDKAVYRNEKKIKPATKFIVLGTVLHSDDFMSRLLKNKDYKHILKRVVDFDVDIYFNSDLWGQFKQIYFNDKLSDSVSAAKEFYYQHEKKMQYKTLWPDKYNCLDLAIDYYNNSRAFRQEMMNDASKIGERWFKSIQTQTPEEIEDHKFVKTILSVDPANSISNKADYSAFAVGSLADNDFIYIRKSILLRLGFNDLCKKVIEFLVRYPDITHISIEKNLYVGSDVLKIKELISKTPELANRNITFINEMARKNKDERISTIVDAANNGQIIFNSDDKESINQIRDFCGQDYSQHDDMPDNIARLVRDLKSIKAMGTIQVYNITF